MVLHIFVHLQLLKDRLHEDNIPNQILGIHSLNYLFWKKMKFTLFNYCQLKKLNFGVAALETKLQVSSKQN